MSSPVERVERGDILHLALARVRSEHRGVIGGEEIRRRVVSDPLLLRLAKADSPVCVDVHGGTVRAVLCDLEIAACDTHRQAWAISVLRRGAALASGASMIVDLQHVRRLSGAMLGALVHIAHRLRSCGGTFALAHVGKGVRQEIRLFRLNNVLVVPPAFREIQRAKTVVRVADP